MQKTPTPEPPRLTSPLPPPCLCRPYSSRPGQKGGTLVAEGITDLATHLQLLSNADAYRPDACPRCGDRLHVHLRVERKLRDQPDATVVDVLCFLCANKDCGGVWRVLPRFLARHLHRTWEVVQHATLSPVRPASFPPVPARTVRRWSARLACCAVLLVQVLATSGEALVAALAQAAGLACSRRDLVEEYVAQTGSDPPLADVAALIHRLCPGVRLM